MRIRWRVFVLSASLAGMAGCSARVQHVTDLPAGVTEAQAKSWDAAVANLHKISATTTTLRQAVIAARNAGGFPSDEYYAAALQGIARVDQIELAAAQMLQQQPKAFGQPQKQQIALYASMITQEAEKLNAAGATQIKNPDSQQQINALLSDLANTVKIILGLAG